MRFLGRAWVGLGCLLVGAMLVLAGCATSSDDSGHYITDPLNPNGADAPPAVATNPGLDATTPAPGSANYITNSLRVGDTIIVTFTDTVTVIPPFQDAIKEDGSITLIWNQKFQAAGKTPKALQEEIRDRYVPKYYNTLTVTVTPAERFFTVSGEVRQPNRYIYTGHMTVLEAIAASGGFTDFSKKTAVQVTRKDKSRSVVDCKKALTNPELNLEIVPGDIIHVKKRILFE